MDTPIRPIALRYGEPASGSPGIADCHLRSRTGGLLPSGQDHWWNLAGDVDDEPLPELFSGAPSALVDAVVAVGVPQLEEFMRPVPAVEWWIRGKDIHVGEERALSYSAIVAATMSGGDAALPRVVEAVEAASELDDDTRRLVQELIKRRPSG